MFPHFGQRVDALLALALVLLLLLRGLLPSLRISGLE